VRPKPHRIPTPSFLRLGGDFDRLHAAVSPLTAERKRLEKIYAEEARRRGFPADIIWNEPWAIATGLPAAADAEDEATEAVDRVTERIRVVPARTFAGLAVKPRALRHDTFLGVIRIGRKDR
jgi:hypothetical protein